MSKTRNILASFKTVDNAKKAAEIIKNLGVSDIQVDQIGMYPGNHLNDLVNPITGGFESLSDLTLGSFTDKNSEILAAADVSASGMSDGNHMEINDNVLLTVVVNEEKAKQIEKIIEDYGGNF